MRRTLLGIFGIVVLTLPAAAGATPVKRYKATPHVACRASYLRRRETINVRGHGKIAKVEETFCVYVKPLPKLPTEPTASTGSTGPTSPSAPTATTPPWPVATTTSLSVAPLSLSSCSTYALGGPVAPGSACFTLTVSTVDANGAPAPGARAVLIASTNPLCQDPAVTISPYVPAETPVVIAIRGDTLYGYEAGFEFPPRSCDTTWEITAHYAGPAGYLPSLSATVTVTSPASI